MTDLRCVLNMGYALQIGRACVGRSLRKGSVLSQFSLTERRQIQVLEVAGELERDRCDHFRMALDMAAEAAGKNPFIVDLSKLAHIGSAGIRTLVLQQRRLAREGRRLVLAGMAGPVRETIEISQVDDLLETNDTVDAAVDLLQNGGANGAHHRRV